MPQRSRDRIVTAIVVLLGALLGAGLAFYPFGSRPRAGALIAFDLRTGAKRFAVDAQTASVRIHAVTRDTIVVTGADDCNNDTSRELMYAYALPGGTLRWKRALRGACFDYRTPERASSGVVAATTPGGLEGWSLADGSTRWRDASIQDEARQTMSAIVSVSSETAVVRFLDPATGRVERSQRAPNKPVPWLQTPTRSVLVTQSSNGPGFEEQLTALDPRSGQRIWKRTLGESGGVEGPSGADGVVVVGFGPSNPSSSNVAFTYAAFDLEHGTPLWRRDQPARYNSLTGELEATGSGLALFVHDGTLEARDLRTGVRHWTKRLQGWRTGYSQIVAQDGSIAVIDQDRVSVFAAADGAERWSATLPTKGLRAHFPVAVSGHLLLVPATSNDWIPYDE
jgi:outer membrane protein assembly factor BamB